MKKILLAASLLLAGTSAMAEKDLGLYVGIGYGKVTQDTGITSITASLDEDDTAGKLYAGYKFHKNIAVELGLTSEASASLSGVTGNTFAYKGTTYVFTQNGSVTSDVSTASLSAVFSYPVHKYVEPFVKIGAHRWSQDITVSSATAGANISESGTDMYFALGSDFPINDSFSARLEFEHYKGDAFDANAIGIGIAYHF